MKTHLSILAAAGLAAAAAAQDLQPGRNYPTSLGSVLGGGQTDEIDAGDIDGDGDLDVVVGNGAFQGRKPNFLFVNQGGLQGGIEGTFVDESALQLAGAPDGLSRDVEFVDVDLDGDLDVFESNGGTLSVGDIARFLINQGGAQGGTAGFYLEETDARWGVLRSVDEVDQLLGGDVGPWRGWSRDADFVDLDLDGDRDLVLSTEGPAFFGNEPTRLFLNDGAGIFHELWPWADGAADVELHATQVHAGDLDGDLDLDLVVASRDSQSRVFLSTLHDGPTAASAYVDATQSLLIDPGSVQIGTSTYEVELVDADGDDDFDLWMMNYDNFRERILRNRGPQGFFEELSWLVGDLNEDEQTIGMVDYDGDGDLDAFTPNFAGLNQLYRSDLAQSGSPGWARTGVGGEPPEMPTSGNNNTSHDGDGADLDGDGDTDLYLGNSGNQQNRILFNELGVPDTHAPRVIAVTALDDGAVGFDRTVTAQLRDNAPWTEFTRYDVELLVSVDGAPETSHPMSPVEGPQYVGFVPGELAGSITYRVRATDANGNVGLSSAQSFVQSAATPWSLLGGGAAGSNGLPRLEGFGSLVAGEPGALSASRGNAGAQAALFVGAGVASAPFKGGTFVPLPILANVPLTTDGWGRIELPWAAWPAGVPSGTELVFQVWIADEAATKSVAGSNAVRATTP